MKVKQKSSNDFLRTFVLLLIGFVLGWNHTTIERWVGEKYEQIRNR